MTTTDLTGAQRAARRERAATAVRDRLAGTWKAWRRPWRRPDFNMAADLAMDALGDLAAEILVDGTMLRALDMKDGVLTLDLEPATDIIKIFTAAMRGVLDGYGAENYVEMEMEVIPSVSMDVRDGSNPAEAYTVTVQRQHKPTPHAFRKRAEGERDHVLEVVTGWCTQAANAPKETSVRDAAVDLMLRLGEAGHSLPEVTA